MFTGQHCPCKGSFGALSTLPAFELDGDVDNVEDEEEGCDAEDNDDGEDAFVVFGGGIVGCGAGRDG